MKGIHLSYLLRAKHGWQILFLKRNIYIYIYIYIYIEFNDKVKQQNLGTAIYATFAPPYACIVMDEVETMNNIIRDHLKAHFNVLKESKLQPFICNPRPIDTLVTKDEVA